MYLSPFGNWIKYAFMERVILPNRGYTSENKYFLHFEKYDYRFHWNNAN